MPARTRCGCGAASSGPCRSSSRRWPAGPYGGGAEDLRHVATLAASDDESIGSVIAEAVDAGGGARYHHDRGVRHARPVGDVVDGIEFDHGYISGYMVTDRERMEAVYDNP